MELIEPNEIYNLLEDVASSFHLEFQMLLGSVGNRQRRLIGRVRFATEIIRFWNYSAHVNLRFI
jgi:hypothetical protein